MNATRFGAVPTRICLSASTTPMPPPPNFSRILQCESSCRSCQLSTGTSRLISSDKLRTKLIGVGGYTAWTIRNRFPSGEMS